jgi:hypothetical protein
LLILITTESLTASSRADHLLLIKFDRTNDIALVLRSGVDFHWISSVRQLTFLSLPPKNLEKPPLQTSLQKFINPVAIEK